MWHVTEPITLYLYIAAVRYARDVLFYLLRLYIGDEDNLKISSRFLIRLSLSDAVRRDRGKKRRFERFFK